MHSHKYNYRLPSNQRDATATPEIDLSEQLEGLHRTLRGQRALLEILDNGFVFVGQHMYEKFLIDLTQDLLPVAAFLNDEAECERDRFWKTYGRYQAQRKRKCQPKEPSTPSHAASSDQSLTLGSSNAEQEG